MLPVPTKIGIIPFTSSTTVSKTNLRSSMVKRDASPVVPRTHNPSVFASLWNCNSLRRDGSSMSPFGRKGVTSAQMEPGRNGFISLALDASSEVNVC